MTIERPMEDDVTALQERVERARGRLAYQFDPALTQALSEEELRAERELAERIRHEERGQRWKEVQAVAAASDRARQTTEAIEKADMRDLLLARRAIAAQRRESSPHAKLASLYRHRAWSLRALAGVVAAGMLWSAVNVQQNIAPNGPSDPLWWFSYLLEAMISVCLIIIMIGTNKVAEWGVIDNRYQVLCAELALLGLTVSLNTYPYVRVGNWYDAAVHAVAPVMIGVALLIHDAVSARYGLAIARATAQVREMPDPGDQIRMRMPAAYRGSAITDLGRPPVDERPELEAVAEYDDYEVIEAEDELPPEDPDNDPDAAEVPEDGEYTETRGAQEVTAFRSAKPVPAQAVSAEAGETAGDAPKPPARKPRVTKEPAEAGTAQLALDDDAPTAVIQAIDPDAPPPAARRAPAKAAKAPAKATAGPVEAAETAEEPAAPKRAAKTARPAAKAAKAAAAEEPAKAAPRRTAAARAAEADEPAARAAKPAATRATKSAAVSEPADPANAPAATAEPATAPAARAAQPAAAARTAQPAAAARSAEPAARPAEPAAATRPAAARPAEPAAATRPAAVRPAEPAAATRPAAARAAEPAARTAQPAARTQSAAAARAAATQPVSRSATARATAPAEAPEADRPSAPVISFASKAAARPPVDREPLVMPMMPIEPTPSRPRSSGPRTGPLAAVRNKAKKSAPEPEPTPISATSEVYDTGALRVADMLEQELAELREKRRQQRAAGRGRASSRDF